MKMFYETFKGWPSVLFSVMLVWSVLSCSGCGEAPQPPFKYSKGDMVTHKVNNARGMIVRSYWYELSPNRRGQEWEKGVPYYDVKFGVGSTVGIDTASGSGFMGSNKHNRPSQFSVERCREFELRRSE